jgi:hypothetical protein
MVIGRVDLNESERQQLSTSIPLLLHELRTRNRRASEMALLSDFGILKCTNFHDHVYGLLSLAVNGHCY